MLFIKLVLEINMFYCWRLRYFFLDYKNIKYKIVFWFENIIVNRFMKLEFMQKRLYYDIRFKVY